MRVPIGPGDQLDHYRVDDLIARSGMVSIFRGTDLRTNQTVAIKIPDPEMESDPVFSDRFHREEEIGKKLTHPGFLKVVADDDHSRLYIVTEWFDGRSLRQILIDESKLSPERAVRIVLSACEALAYLHGHGIVHRDLRPENILVDSANHVRIVDFGAAAKVGSRRITFANLSQVVGMSRYISPEELNGKRGDARSDIYALGVILYEMLTGRQPFKETNFFDRGTRNLVPARENDSSISPQLQEVIYRALEPEHKNRYASTHEFALDLIHLDHVKVADRSKPKVWMPSSSKARKILLYLSIASIPAVIFALLVFFAYHYPPTAK